MTRGTRALPSSAWPPPFSTTWQALATQWHDRLLLNLLFMRTIRLGESTMKLRKVGVRKYEVLFSSFTLAVTKFDSDSDKTHFG